MRVLRARGLLLALILAMGTGSATAQPMPQRVRPDAREILSYRLTLDGFRKFTRVTTTMDSLPPARTPDAVRADSAFFGILTMAWAHKEPWADKDVAEHTRIIDSGHYDLARAIRGAGLTTREYLLTQMTLLLAHPLIERKRHGLIDPPPTDVAAENVAFVEANWAEVNAYMTNVFQRIGRERGGR